MTFYLWSRTASADANADPTVNWSEGMAPSSVNDSGRAMMAAAAKYRDDVTGAIVTTGTGVNYAVSSFQGFDTLAHLSGQIIAFTPHVTNTGNQAFLNVDGLGSKTLRLGKGIDVGVGTLIQGTPYEAVYNITDDILYLKSFFNSPYLIPLAASLEYWAPTTPSSIFAFAAGQAISRTTYASLFEKIGTTYGNGDGSGTTFSLPDCRGRVVGSPDNMGGFGDANRLAGSGITTQRTTLGGVGGEGTHGLTLGEIPSGITSSGSGPVAVTTDRGDIFVGNADPVVVNLEAQASALKLWSASAAVSRTAITSSGSAAVSVVSNNTGSTGPHNNVQPTILANRIMRVL